MTRWEGGRAAWWSVWWCAQAGGGGEAPKRPVPLAGPTQAEAHLGLYTILPSPILYGVWRKKGGVGVRVRVNRVYCAKNVQ